MLRLVQACVFACAFLRCHAISATCSDDGAAECDVPADGTSLLQKVQSHTSVSVSGAALSERDNSCHAVGAKAWVSSHGVNYMLGSMMPPVVEKISKADIPTVSGVKSGFKYAISSIKLREFRTRPPVVSFGEEEGIGVDIQDLTVAASFHYSIDGADWYNPLSTSGWVHLDLSALLLCLMQVGVSPAGRPSLDLAIHNVVLTLGEFKVEGTIFAGLVNLLVSIFKSQLQGLVATAIKDNVASAANTYLNDYFASMSLTVALPLPKPYDFMSADFTLCFAEVGPGHLTFGVVAAAVDATQTQPTNFPRDTRALMYSAAPPELHLSPPKELEDTCLGLGFSSWSPNSVFWLLFQRNLLHYTLNPRDVPDKANIPLNMQTARRIVRQEHLPRTAAAGMAMPFVIDISAHSPPEVNFHSGLVEVVAEVKMGLRWDGDAETFLSFIAPLRALGQVAITQGENGTETAEASIVNASGTPVTILDGDQSVILDGLNEFVDALAHSTLMPLVNGLVNGGFPLPQAAGIQWTHSKVIVEEGDAAALTSFEIDVHQFEEFINNIIG